MSELLTPPPETAAPKTVGRIETDTFCEHCGYNLFTLAVWRDERLGILIVRCPECGGFQPAGRAAGAGRVWLNRLGTVLLTAWVFFLLGAIGLLGFFIGLWEAILLDEYVRRLFSNSSYFHDYYSGDRRYYLYFEVGLLLGLTGFTTLLLGMFVPVFLWHLRRWVHFLFLAVPFLVAGVLWCALVLPPYVAHHAALAQFVVIVGLLVAQVGIMVVGFLLGRPVARLTLRLFLPRTLVQHLGFLWTVDGRTPPAVRR